MKAITAINQKGGVGKTSIALATAHGLARGGARVLFIDLDPQQNASSVLGVKGETPTSLDLLEGNAGTAETIKKAGALDAIPADPQAAGADKRIDGVGAEHRLREAIEGIAASYDYCIIDTPPALGILTANALTASDTAVIPAQADIFSLEGISQLAQTIQAIRQYSNPSLTLSGILLTRFNARATLSRDIREAAQDAAEALGTRVFDATIREGIAVKEAQAMGRSVYEYAPRANVTKDLEAYLEELKRGL